MFNLVFTICLVKVKSKRYNKAQKLHFTNTKYKNQFSNKLIPHVLHMNFQ